MMDRWEQIDRRIERVEEVILVLSLCLMLLLAGLQIALRNLFSTGLSWGDPLVRNLVLWVGFIGATLATREGKHINIDLVSRGLPPGGRRAVDFFIHLFSSLVCVLLTVAALKFVRNEARMGDTTFLGVPNWVPEMILPGAFGLIALRFALRCLSVIFRNRNHPLPGGGR